MYSCDGKAEVSAAINIVLLNYARILYYYSIDY